MPARCDRIQMLVPRLFSGHLPDSVVALVRDHLDTCPFCGPAWREREQRRLQDVALRPPRAQCGALGRPLSLARPVAGTTFETALGWHALGRTAAGLAVLSAACPDREGAAQALAAALPQADLTWENTPDGGGRRVATKLRWYLDCHPVTFDEPVDVSALPPFQQQVLAVTRTIPYGQMRTYGWIAQRLRRPGAARSVGQALHHNPLAPVIPCHRVVGARGQLTGYAWGLPAKRWLLDVERNQRHLL